MSNPGTFLPLSTLHLTGETKLWLDQELSDLRGRRRPPELHGAIHFYGWFVFADDMPRETWPADLRACMAHARGRSAEWILFDEGSPVEPCLPGYGSARVMVDPDPEPT